MMENDCNENDLKIIEKVKFFGSQEIKSHVLTVPKPTFKNGLFVSGLKDGVYFWFIENDTSMPIRLFLSEIHDIEEYKEKEEVKDEL